MIKNLKKAFSYLKTGPRRQGQKNAEISRLHHSWFQQLDQVGVVLHAVIDRDLGRAETRRFVRGGKFG